MTSVVFEMIFDHPKLYFVFTCLHAMIMIEFREVTIIEVCMFHPKLNDNTHDISLSIDIIIQVATIFQTSLTTYLFFLLFLWSHNITCHNRLVEDAVWNGSLESSLPCPPLPSPRDIHLPNMDHFKATVSDSYLKSEHLTFDCTHTHTHTHTHSGQQ